MESEKKLREVFDAAGMKPPYTEAEKPTVPPKAEALTEMIKEAE